MFYSNEVQTQIYNEIVAAASSEKGRITPSDLANKFPELGFCDLEGDVDAQSVIRDIILEINLESEDRLVAEDTGGYFIPKTRAESEAYAERVQQASEDKIQAAQVEVQLIKAKVRQLASSLGGGAKERDLRRD